MKSFFARFCGHHDRLNKLHQEISDADRRVTDLERRLDRSRILRVDAERQLLEASTDLIRTRNQRDDLTELLQDQVDREQIINLLINAKRATGLSHSGPTLTRQRIDQAITLLRGAQ